MLQHRAPPPRLAGRMGARRATASPSQLRGAPRRAPRRHPPSAPRAALYQLPPDLGDALRTAAGVSCVLALALSAMPILTGEAKERNERPLFAPGSSDDFAGGVKWGVMAVLSCIPLLNPLAWVFAALDDEDSSALYSSFAFLYSLPYLASGLELDSFVLVALGACAAHVQIERLARTEPVEVEVPEVLRSALRMLPDALRGVGRVGEALGGQVEGRVRSADAARRRRPDRKALESQSREARMELDEFDRRAAAQRARDEERRR